MKIFHEVKKLPEEFVEKEDAPLEEMQKIEVKESDIIEENSKKEENIESE